MVNDVAAAYRAAGMSEAMISKKLGSDVTLAEHYEVWPDCWDVVQIFLALGRQWRTCISPSGHIVREGIDLSVLPVIADAYGIDVRDRWVLVKDLRIMEEAACAVFRERLDRELNSKK